MPSPSSTTAVGTGRASCHPAVAPRFDPDLGNPAKVGVPREGVESPHRQTNTLGASLPCLKTSKGEQAKHRPFPLHHYQLSPLEILFQYSLFLVLNKHSFISFGGPNSNQQGKAECAGRRMPTAFGVSHSPASCPEVEMDVLAYIRN